MEEPGVRGAEWQTGWEAGGKGRRVAWWKAQEVRAARFRWQKAPSCTVVKAVHCTRVPQQADGVAREELTSSLCLAGAAGLDRPRHTVIFFYFQKHVLWVLRTPLLWCSPAHGHLRDETGHREASTPVWGQSSGVQWGDLGWSRPSLTE